MAPALGMGHGAPPQRPLGSPSSPAGNKGLGLNAPNPIHGAPPSRNSPSKSPGAHRCQPRGAGSAPTTAMEQGGPQPAPAWQCHRLTPPTSASQSRHRRPPCVEPCLPQMLQDPPITAPRPPQPAKRNSAFKNRCQFLHREVAGAKARAQRWLTGTRRQRICSCLEEAEELNLLKAPYFSKKNQFFPHRVISFLKPASLLSTRKSAHNYKPRKKRFLEIFICS